MKKMTVFLALMLSLLLTACAAPPQKEIPKALTLEQQLSDAAALCRQDMAAGLRALEQLDARVLGGGQLRGDDYILAVWQLQQGEDVLLLWRLDCTAEKEYPDTLDTIYLTWEEAEYYCSTGDDTYSTVQGRQRQCVSFNVEDQRMSAGSSTCGAVYLQSAAERWEVQLVNTFAAEETALWVERSDNGEAVTATTAYVPQQTELSVSAQLKKED